MVKHQLTAMIQLPLLHTYLAEKANHLLHEYILCQLCLMTLPFQTIVCMRYHSLLVKSACPIENNHCMINRPLILKRSCIFIE